MNHGGTEDTEGEGLLAVGTAMVSREDGLSRTQGGALG